MTSTAVDILVMKGRFDPQVAAALAEAMDTTMVKASCQPKSDLYVELQRAKSDVLCQMYKALTWQTLTLVASIGFLIGIAMHR